MSSEPIVRDERTVAVENSSYRWAYLLMSYGLLVITAYRSFVQHEQSWDTLILVIAGGVVANIYQGTQHVLSRRWAIMSGIAIGLALLLAVVLMLMHRPAQ